MSNIPTKPGFYWYRIRVADRHKPVFVWWYQNELSFQVLGDEGRRKVQDWDDEKFWGGKIDAIDPPEPELPEVEVFDATTPGNVRYRYVETCGQRWFISPTGRITLSLFKRSDFTDIRPVTPKPASRELLKEAEVELRVWMSHTTSRTAIDRITSLLQKLRRHTDPVLVTVDESLLKAVEKFLWAVGYRDWKLNVAEVVARWPNGDTHQCGTIPFRELVEAAELRRAEG